MTDTRSAAWDTYARSKPQRRRTNARGETTWFNWTQYADHGPGAEVLALDSGDTALDLGCGSGGNLAHLAKLGMRAVGVDLSPKQLDKARERWLDADGMELHQGDALAYLGETSTVFDAVFSVFGAVWFTDPGALLPVVHANLRPGGVFAFSQRPPVEGCYGCQASYIPRGPDVDPAIVKRWDYEPETWCSLLEDHGFSDATATVLPAPERDPRTTGTLLVRAARGDGAQSF
ncbi:class I SAM-dependent methyltransferase [Streptomyces sp. NPDC088757]|uniref:class I SAM-dependent methyltransferase n=1 Tax=Streptomyces sp. NPDC088757 TaxID=3365889 RepID=UPI00380013EB